MFEVYEVCNNTPKAENMSMSLTEGNVQEINLAGSDIEEGELTYEVIRKPRKGTLSSLIGNTLHYTAKKGYVGKDSFTYRLIDSKGERSRLAIVKINILANNVPVAEDLNIEVIEDSTQNITLKGSDHEDDDATLIYEIVGTPINGFLSGFAGSALDYTPEAGFTGEDNFTYQVMDSGGVISDLATVYLNISEKEIGPLELAAVPIEHAEVAVFDNRNFVDTDGGSHSESDNVQATLLQLDHNVSTFTDYTGSGFSHSLIDKDVLLIPEMEKGDLSEALTSEAISTIQTFVKNGGTFIINGVYFDYDVKLLNRVFNFELVDQGIISFSTEKAKTAVGSTFALGVKTLTSPSATTAIYENSLPEGSRIIYQSEKNVSVAAMPYSEGQIIYLGWDWYNAAPVGSVDSGWVNVLKSAISKTSR